MSLMIIMFIGFILFFVASHLANKKNIPVDKKTQLTDNTIKKEVPKPSLKSKPKPKQTEPKTTSLSVKPQSKAATKTVISKKMDPPKKQPKPMPETPKPVRKFIQKDKVIQYETVRDNSEHPDRTLMNKRKKTFGINKSLDLIVKPDEKVQVGDSVAPIKKISERLQLEQGRIIENTIDEPFQLPQPSNILQSQNNQTVQKDRPTKKTQKITIEKQLNSASHLPSIPESIPIELDNPEKSSNDQGKSIPGYPFIDKSSIPYQKMIKAISKKQTNQKTGPSIGGISPETQLDIYSPQSPKPFETSTYLGIHVVQPGTNIWDIHFDLLKEYFKHKGVSLSPHADEPKKSGESTGVGKILKFSEQLVNIYNLETQTFENNLDVIQPMTVIVIYNMSQIFGILDDIDYSVIDRIEFDGESLWIPAVQ